MVVGSFFYYVRAKSNAYSAYGDTNKSYQSLVKGVLRFMSAKKRAEVVASDIITHEEVIAKRMEERIGAVERSVNKVLKILSEQTSRRSEESPIVRRKTEKLEVMEEIKD